MVHPDLGGDVDGVDGARVEHRLNVAEDAWLDVILEISHGDRLVFEWVAELPPARCRLTATVRGEEEAGAGRIARADRGDPEIILAGRSQGSVATQVGRDDPPGSDQADSQRRHGPSRGC